MKTVLVTGVPGTGKSVLAEKLSLLLGYAYVDIGNELKKAGLYSTYDAKRRCYTVEAGRLVAFLQKVRENGLRNGLKGMVLDSHMSHFLPWDAADLCLVVVCSDLEALKSRLTSRGYHSAKVRENMDAEIFEVCLTEAREAGHHVVIFDSATADEVAERRFLQHVRKLLEEDEKPGTPVQLSF